MTSLPDELKSAGLFLKRARQFVQHVSNLLDIAGIPTRDSKTNERIYIMDHVCYRIRNHEDWQTLMKMLIGEDKYATHVITTRIPVGEEGRPVSIIKLHTDHIIYAAGFAVQYIEIPYPRKTGDQCKYKYGWQHAEIAVGMKPEQFMELYPTIEGKREWITKSMSKNINADISLKFKNKSLVTGDSEGRVDFKNDPVVKFHEHSIGDVINLPEEKEEREVYNYEKLLENPNEWEIIEDILESGEEICPLEENSSGGNDLALRCVSSVCMITLCLTMVILLTLIVIYIIQNYTEITVFNSFDNPLDRYINLN